MFLFFRFIFKKNLPNTVLIIYQTKPCFHPELDTKSQTKEAFLKEKEGWWGVFVVDDALFEIGWVDMALMEATAEPANKEILSVSTFKETNMFVVAECFLSGLLEEPGEHPVSTDGETW